MYDVYNSLETISIPFGNIRRNEVYLFCGLFIRNSGIVAVLIAESSLIVAATINIPRMAISPL